ncbi:MAG: tetratricopeptide repeat protein [Bacteroidales bacterium]|nr:tetratricopeptide repeat protein [Bacteroidales bacterium]
MKKNINSHNIPFTMKSGRNIAPFLISAVVTLTVCTSAFSAVPRTALSSAPALVSYAHVPTVPNDRKTFRYAVTLYDSGMYERAAEIFAGLSGAGAVAWDNGAIAAGDSFDTPADGLGAIKIDFDGATDIEALGYYVLCAVKMQTRGYTVLANSYILKYPYGSLVPQIRFAHATLCFDLGDYKGADNQLEPLSRRKLYHNQIPDFLFMRALCSLELGEETAAARFTDIINYKKSNRYVLPAHYFLGYINYENGNLSEAREHFALAVADPRFKSLAEHYLVECGGNVGQTAETSAATQTTATPATQTTTSTTTETAAPATTPVPTAPESSAGEAAYHRILDSYDKGNFDDVEDLVLDFAESDNPNRYWLAKSFIVLGDSYAEQGDFAKALTTFESVRDGYNPAEPDDVKDELEMRIRRSQEMLNKN